MSQPTYDHIQQLLHDSGLIHSKLKLKKTFQNFDFKNETILITGAAGSIGSELARHLLACKYKKLILMDIAESPLYNLIKEFENEDISKIEFLLLNINEKDSVEYLFENYKPSLIFHAAAYKHVPLMEAHPYEAVKTNIIATKLLADLSIKFRVKKFVFISTDKAVNPISAMGISKRIAEKYLISLSKKNTARFLIARFGNIMGSSGSVLPLFIKQIESGLPLTVTNETISRYFINKHKACNLILEIANFNKLESNVFTFNMGEPIKIIELANCLKTIYSETYKEQEIEIKITGLRPGEKDKEDIISENEYLESTLNKDILMVKQKNTLKPDTLDFSDLLNMTSYQSSEEIKNILMRYL